MDSKCQQLSFRWSRTQLVPRHFSWPILWLRPSTVAFLTQSNYGISTQHCKRCKCNLTLPTVCAFSGDSWIHNIGGEWQHTSHSGSASPSCQKEIPEIPHHLLGNWGPIIAGFLKDLINKQLRFKFFLPTILLKIFAEDVLCNFVEEVGIIAQFILRETTGEIQCSVIWKHGLQRLITFNAGSVGLFLHTHLSPNMHYLSKSTRCDNINKINLQIITTTHLV